MNIFVGNLSRDVEEDELRQAFQEFGTVTSVAIIKDRLTGNPRGFGFVEMSSNEEAEAAIAGLNGRELKGRALNVNQARPKSDRPGGGGGGGRMGGGGGFRSGGGRSGGGGGGGRRGGW
jgi:RNA recognition motif-containing protein